jgi:hypothetical protein
LLTTAGITTYYDSVSNGNWANIESMYAGLIAFVTKNESILKTKGYMPDSFLGELNQLSKDYSIYYATFQAEDSVLVSETNKKTEQVNLLVDGITAIFADAQVVYHKDAIKSSEYTFESYKRLINPPNAASIFFRLFNMVNKRSIMGADIRMTYFDKETQSDKIGGFSFNQLPEGTYTLYIEAKGCVPITLTDVLVAKGKRRYFKPIEMTPIKPDDPTPVTPIVLKAEQIVPTRK